VSSDFSNEACQTDLFLLESLGKLFSGKSIKIKSGAGNGKRKNYETNSDLHSASFDKDSHSPYAQRSNSR